MGLLITYTVLFVLVVGGCIIIALLRKHRRHWLPGFLQELDWMPIWMRDFYEFEDFIGQKLPERVSQKICGDLEEQRRMHTKEHAHAKAEQFEEV